MVLYDQYLKGLPVVASFRDAINQKNLGISVYLDAILGIVILISLLSFLWRRHQDKNFWKYLWVRYKHIFVGLLLVVSIYLFCIQLMIFGENLFFQDNGIKSSILDMTNTDIYLWNLVRIFANNDGGIFPISIMGKLAATLSTYVIWIGTLSVAVVEFIMHKLIAKRRDGLMNIKDKDHIVIAGWNDNTPQLIEELLCACEEYHRRKLKIVCVVSDPREILEKYKYISDLESRKELILIKGYVRNKNILEKCNAQHAKLIILLSEETDMHADEKKPCQ